MKPSGIGGQAVLEGVMMKNKSKYAVAVRKPDNNIEVDIREYHTLDEKYPFLKLPVLRGIVSFAESMIIGMKTLTFSADLLEEAEIEEENRKNGKSSRKKENNKSDGAGNVITVLISILLAVGIFMVLPYFLSRLFENHIKNSAVLTLIEGIIRIVLFIGYVLAISLMPDIKRVFMYHGAEHKTINCLENGYELNVQNVRKQSKHHKRCGTSFMLIVMFVSIVLFMFIKTSSPVLRLVLRLLLIPVIAGISYEFIKLAGRSENKVIGILSKPGMWLQALTTREPDDDMIEIAIASVDAVFDWENFLEDNGFRKSRKKSLNKNIKSRQNSQQSKDVKGSRKKAKQAEMAADDYEANQPKIIETGRYTLVKDKKSKTYKKVFADENAEGLEENANTAYMSRHINAAGGADGYETAAKENPDRDEAAELTPEQISLKKQAELKSKVIIKEDTSTSLLEQDEEDDDVLKALDHFFVYEGKKTVMERGEEKKH